MSSKRLRRFLKSPTAGLAGTYLLIIMAMSIGFSLVFYNTSSYALGRQLPPDDFLHAQGYDDHDGQAQVNSQTGQVTPGNKALSSYLQQRIDEGRNSLRLRLIYLNLGALVVGSIVSYSLARRSLRPIEQAMEAQAQFVSDASHELRTPLTAIQASNEVFLRRSKQTLTEARRLIEQNTDDVTRLKHLSDGLLKLSQEGNSQHVKYRPLHVQDVVSEALTQVVQQATQKDVSVHDETPDIQAVGDPATLTQALVILLDNAVKYSRPGGTVSVNGGTKGKYAYVAVHDEGIGIRASDMPHLFRRFYRADNARSGGAAHHGYGLGLAIAKQIIDNHHGHIEVSSTPGKGSTFTLKLPGS